MPHFRVKSRWPSTSKFPKSTHRLCELRQVWRRRTDSGQPLGFRRSLRLLVRRFDVQMGRGFRGCHRHAWKDCMRWIHIFVAFVGLQRRLGILVVTLASTCCWCIHDIQALQKVLKDVIMPLFIARFIRWKIFLLIHSFVTNQSLLNNCLTKRSL